MHIEYIEMYNVNSDHVMYESCIVLRSTVVRLETNDVMNASATVTECKINLLGFDNRNILIDFSIYPVRVHCSNSS